MRAYRVRQKIQPLEKLMYAYFNNGSTDLSQTFRLYMSNAYNATYPENFIKTAYTII